MKYLVNDLGIEDEETECYMLGYFVRIYTEFLTEIHKNKKEELIDENII